MPRVMLRVDCSLAEMVLRTGYTVPAARTVVGLPPDAKLVSASVEVDTLILEFETKEHPGGEIGLMFGPCPPELKKEGT